MNAVVIIPAYDPDENLKKIVDRVWDLGNQVIVVDDGSDPSKMPIFDELCEDSIVLHHSENKGKGAAIKTALLYIKRNLWDCNVVGVMDADGQHLPEDMEKLVMKANLREGALFLGVRKIDNDMPIKSRIGNSITRNVFRRVSGVNVSDTQTGLRAFSVGLIDEFLKVEGTRYEYETNVLFHCAKEEIPIEEVPIHTIYHDEANSCSHFHAVRDSVRIYKDILKFSFSSLSSFVLDYLLFCLLVLICPENTAGLLAANVIARVASEIYNYTMNCRFVFHDRAKKQTAAQYIGLAAAILFLNNIILQLYSTGFGIPVFAAKIMTEISLFIISFWVQKKIIFRLRSDKKEMMRA